jgi:quinol monooxygenase YgiN
MYVMAAHWTFKPGSSEEVIDIARDVVMPTLEARPGFVRSTLVQTGQDSFLSFVGWADEEDAKLALAEMAPLMIRHLGHLIRDVERLPGTVVYEHWAERHAVEARVS